MRTRSLRPGNRTWAAVAVLSAVLIAVFVMTVIYRRPWFGSVGRGLSVQFLTHALLFARNWYREGVFALRLGMFLDPLSVEMPVRDLSSAYTSYPPGASLPVLVLGLLARHEPSLSLLMAWNLANQLGIALLLAWTAFIVLRRIHGELLGTSILACVPGLLYLLLPSPLYQHQMRYFADQAVLMPFVLFVFLETVRGDPSRGSSRRSLAVLQGVVACAGMLTDYLFALVGLCVYFKRVMREGKRGSWRAFFVRTLLFWLPFALALAFFGWQVHVFHGFGDLRNRLELWTESPLTRRVYWSLDNYFWRVHMVRGYGKAGIALTWLALVGFMVLAAWAACRRALRKPADPQVAELLSLGFVTLAPCWLHFALLKNHSAFPLHSFAALKFAVPLVMVVFVILPVFVAMALRRDLSLPRIMRPLSLAVFLLAGVFAGMEAPRIPVIFGQQPVTQPLKEAAEFVGAHTQYCDIVFSLDSSFRLAHNSPLTALSMKAIHLAVSLQSLYDVVAHVEADYVISILSHDGQTVIGTNVDGLIPKSFETSQSGRFRLDRIHKNDFLDLCRESHVSLPPDTVNATGPATFQPGQSELVRRLGDMGIDVEAMEDEESGP